MRIIRKLLWFLFLLFLVLASIGVGYYFAVTKDAVLQPEKLTLNEQTLLLYDGNGDEITSVATLDKQTVKIDKIAKSTQLAVIATEDKRFYKHNGFDIKRIARAVVNNAKAKSFKEGASTISQQLIKNTHLSQEKTIRRKLKEWKLTRKLERAYTKDEILEKYLNTIYFGHSCFGIRAAAEFYFGKPPSELTVADSAVLAGLIKSPNNYSPFKNAESCQKRKATVLSLMLKNGYLTENERAAALQEPLPTAPKRQRANDGFLTFVFDELEELAKERQFRLGGNIQIFTELDQILQSQVNEIAQRAQGCDKTLLVLDGEKKRFKACVSTVGNIPRLPGSLIKPLLVYAPALEENLISPATPILDEKVNYGGYAPENYDGKFHGYVSARESLAKSLNIPAVKVLQSLGVEKAVAYTDKLGLQVDKSDYSLALALGGMKNGFPLRDLVSAYATFQDGGRTTDCAFIKEIRINGICVYRHKPKGERAFREETAYLATNMLQSAVKDGTAKKLRDLPVQIAAKTGTVGTDKGNTDAYALSYTTKDVTAVWLGNADNTLIEHTGGGLPCTLLHDINEALLQGYTAHKIHPAPFPRPQGVVEVALDKQSYYDTHTMLLADDIAPIDFRFTELFQKDAVPTKKSYFFTCPSISTPTVALTSGGVKITFPAQAPSVYRYRIERYDYTTHTTVYEGEFLPQFTDTKIEPNKRYLYTVTPLYADKTGKSVQLPEINTANLPGDKIAEKEWWNY